MSWYRTGTVSVTNGSTTVTGTTTGWLSQVRAEDRISFNGGDKWYEVASVASNTSLTLATAFAETTISGGAYAIDRSSRVWDQTSNVASQIRTLLASVTNILQGTGAPSNSLGADGDVYVQTDLLTFFGPKAAGSWPAGIPFGSRPSLSADRTYYVRPDGSDSNDGLANTAAGAFLTIQRAVDVAAGLDLGIYNVTINVAPGTYTGQVVLKAQVGAGTINIRGDTSTPGNVIISTATNAFVATNGGVYDIRGFRVTTTSGTCFNIQGRAKVAVGNIEFASCPSYHLFAAGAGTLLQVVANCSITSGSNTFCRADNAAQIQFFSGLTHTLTGTPNFTGLFAYANRTSTIIIFGQTWSGAATGVRYSAISNGVIETNGGGANYLPGNSAGSTATGGQYV